MSGLDIFAWIVLIILVASAIAVFCIAGWLPGHIAKTRGHPWAEAVTVAGWITLICGFALWPVALIWAYVDVPAARTTGDGAMIVVLLNVYLVLLFLLVKLKIVRFNLFWKVSPFIVFLLLLIGLFIPMGWGAPQGSAVVVRNSVAIVPDVAGEVIDVPVDGQRAAEGGRRPVPYRSRAL